MRRVVRSVWLLIIALTGAMLAGCALWTDPGRVAIGAPAAEVVKTSGEPTGRYRLRDGGERLEYARGPAGRQTWMVDLDAQGRVRAVTQVLTEARFNQVLAGTSREDLLVALGRPASRLPGGWPGGEVWSWRYESLFCTWFQASIGTDGRVRDTAYNDDPACGDLATP